MNFKTKDFSESLANARQIIATIEPRTTHLEQLFVKLKCNNAGTTPTRDVLLNILSPCICHVYMILLAKQRTRKPRKIDFNRVAIKDKKLTMNPMSEPSEFHKYTVRSLSKAMWS